jgi:flagellar hook assembly protein FlgD
MLHLYPASPNPFGSQGVYLTYFLSVDARVQVRVWDVSGEAVRDLDPVWGHAGDNELFWDGRNRAGRPVASGTYVYRLSATSRRDEKAAEFGKCAAVR